MNVNICPPTFTFYMTLRVWMTNFGYRLICESLHAVFQGWESKKLYWMDIMILCLILLTCVLYPTSSVNDLQVIIHPNYWNSVFIYSLIYPNVIFISIWLTFFFGKQNIFYFFVHTMKVSGHQNCYNCYKWIVPVLDYDWFSHIQSWCKLLQKHTVHLNTSVLLHHCFQNVRFCWQFWHWVA